MMVIQYNVTQQNYKTDLFKSISIGMFHLCIAFCNFYRRIMIAEDNFNRKNR